jgi:hypothetical protein
MDMGYSAANELHIAGQYPKKSDCQAKMSDLFEGIVCMGEGIDVDGVIQRLRRLYGVSTDKALGEAMGVPSTTLSSWRKNARVPMPECVQAVRKYRCSWDWLLTGAAGGVRDEGEIYVTDERMQRIAAFLQHWGATRNADEKAWLEMQLARAVPEYAEWLAKRSKA